jgi:hypothetical protein
MPLSVANSTPAHLVGRMNAARGPPRERNDLRGDDSYPLAYSNGRVLAMCQLGRPACNAPCNLSESHLGVTPSGAAPDAT